MSSLIHRAVVIGAALSLSLTAPLRQAHAWGDEGHEIIALVADHFLDAAVKQKVAAMLAADTDNLTAHDIASEAIWADKYRDSDRNTTKVRYNQTHLWHFVDIELDHPDIDAACFGHPALPAGTPAIQGPAKDCVVDKINQFAAELADPATSPEERLDALKFVLHFVGDVHQPLHASDNHDADGNRVEVTATAFSGHNLYQFWDTEVVEELGDDPKAIAADLIGGIDQNHAFAAMSKGAPSDWAMEAFQAAKDHAYGRLPAPNADGGYTLQAPYVTDAIQTARVQLARAGVRLAAVLNGVLK